MGVIKIWGVATRQSGSTVTYVPGFMFQKLFSITCFAFDVSSRHNSPWNKQSLWMSSSEEDASAREMQPASNFSQSTINSEMLITGSSSPVHLDLSGHAPRASCGPLVSETVLPG
jgi:hypothetical protein